MLMCHHMQDGPQGVLEVTQNMSHIRKMELMFKTDTDQTKLQESGQLLKVT
jgi:hypothetical protein